MIHIGPISGDPLGVYLAIVIISFLAVPIIVFGLMILFHVLTGK